MFSVQRNFITKQEAAAMADRLEHCFILGKTEYCSETKSEDANNLFIQELVKWKPAVESIFNVDLFPTYNWSKLYNKGGILPAHVDRDNCEYSVTLCLENETSPWPIFLETSQGVVEVLLDQGDALFYKGIEQRHWRNELKDGCVYQSFFHYVNQNGPYAALKYKN